MESEVITITTDETYIHLLKTGSGPALLLLHGFPETHLMWQSVLPFLENEFTLICPDLRGYGASGCPPSDAQHTPYSKRAMAKDMVTLMEKLGFKKFFVAGHDRGGRVAYRLALDCPKAVERLAVLDILPTIEVWERVDKKFIRGFWPWSLLAQPYPLPEHLILNSPEAAVLDALSNWGTPLSKFPRSVQEEYISQFRDSKHVHAICEEYRAATTLDCLHDEHDRAQSRRIDCSVLVVWSADGSLGTWYNNEGGPVSIWKKWAYDVTGLPIHAGHFFPEEAAEETADILRTFFSGSP